MRSAPGCVRRETLGGNGVTPIMLHPLSSRFARPSPLHTTAFLLVSLFATVEAQQVVYVDTTAAEPPQRGLPYALDDGRTRRHSRPIGIVFDRTVEPRPPC